MNLHFFSTILLKTTTIFNKGVLTHTRSQSFILGMLTININEILDLQISRNVSIMVLRVMTLVIVIHCTHNFVITNLLTTRMVKSKEDMGKD
jgi:hypothetical protein